MSAQMFYAVPKGKPSLRQAYEAWAQTRTLQGAADPGVHPKVDPRKLSVGIVGGGMAGLYAALRLQAEGAAVHVFEADCARLGGRVYTHRFNSNPNQYFEAGAMRLPEIAEQKPVFDLIDYLNQINRKSDPQSLIETLPYVLFDEKGRDLVFVNGRRGPDGLAMTAKYANDNPELAPKQMDFYDKMLGKGAVDSLLTNGYSNGLTSADAKIASSERGNTLPSQSGSR